MGASHGPRVMLGVKNHLGDPFAIPQVHENQPSMVAAALHPAHEGNRLIDMGSAQSVAVVGLSPISQGVKRDWGDRIYFLCLFRLFTSLSFWWINRSLSGALYISWSFRATVPKANRLSLICHIAQLHFSPADLFLPKDQHILAPSLSARRI